MREGEKEKGIEGGRREGREEGEQEECFSYFTVDSL